MVMMPKRETARTPEEEARREYVRATLKWLVKRHHKSLEILAAYDRGEIERPQSSERTSE